MTFQSHEEKIDRNVDRRYDFLIKYNVDPQFIDSRRSYAGVNRLYNSTRKTFYYMIDVDDWKIYTNNRKFNNRIGQVTSTSKKPNVKFKVTKLLTDWFYKQDFIPNHIRHRYYNRIRDLLLTQYYAIKKRQNESKTNRRTKTYIRFSYKRRVVYLGIYLKCNHDKCVLPVHYVMKNRDTEGEPLPHQYCIDHAAEHLITDAQRKGKDKEKIQPFELKKEKKIIYNNRLGIIYTKLTSKFYHTGGSKQGSESYTSTYKNYQFIRHQVANSIDRVVKKPNRKQEKRLERYYRKERLRLESYEDPPKHVQRKIDHFKKYHKREEWILNIPPLVKFSQHYARRNHRPYNRKLDGPTFHEVLNPHEREDKEYYRIEHKKKVLGQTLSKKERAFYYSRTHPSICQANENRPLRILDVDEGARRRLQKYYADEAKELRKY